MVEPLTPAEEKKLQKLIKKRRKIVNGERVKLSDEEDALRLALLKQKRQANIGNVRSYRVAKPAKKRKKMPDNIKALAKDDPRRMAWLRKQRKIGETKYEIDKKHNKRYWDSRKARKGLVNDEYTINQYKYAKLMKAYADNDEWPPYSKQLSHFIKNRTPTPGDRAYIKYFYPIRTRQSGKKAGKMAFATLPTDPQFLRGRKLQKMINMYIKKYQSRKHKNKKKAVNSAVRRLEKKLNKQGLELPKNFAKNYKHFFNKIDVNAEMVDPEGIASRSELFTLVRKLRRMWNDRHIKINKGDPMTIFLRRAAEAVGKDKLDDLTKQFIEENVYFKNAEQKDDKGNVRRVYVKACKVPEPHAGWGYRGYGLGKIVKKGVRGVAKGVGTVRKGVNYVADKAIGGVDKVIPGSGKVLRTGNKILKKTNVISSALMDAGGYALPVGIGTRILGYGLSDGAGFIDEAR